MSWVLITLLAVVSQLLRNIFSKKLSQNFSSETVSLARFLYGIPIVLTGYFIGKYFYGSVEILSLQFFFWVFIFALTQIIANTLLIALFHQKNFAVSITYIKTETLFTALLAFLFLSEYLSFFGWLGVIIAFFGLVLASFAKEKIGFMALKNSLHQKSSYLGILSGFLFAIAVIAIKNSFLFLETSSIFMKSSFSLLVALCMQTLFLIFYVSWKKKDEFFTIIKSPKIPFIIGTLSGVGSFFWFFAFAITSVAFVKTLGQIEFLLGVLISVYFFKEKIYQNEIFGMILLIIGTIFVIFS